MYENNFQGEKLYLMINNQAINSKRVCNSISTLSIQLSNREILTLFSSIKDTLAVLYFSINSDILS